MNCDEVRRSVQEYVMRELEPESRRLFDAHLVECAACQRELALMTALVSTLDHQPVLEPPPGFGEKVLASLPRQQGFVPSPWWSLAPAPLLAGLVWLARGPVTRELSRLFDRLPHAPAQLPAPTAPQLAAVAAAAVTVGLLMSAGAAYFCWEHYLRD